VTDAPETAATHPAARTGATSVQVFVRDEDSEGTLRQTFSNLNIRDTQFVTGNIDTAVTALGQLPSPRLLIVDISDVTDPLASVNELANVCEPNTDVIAIGDRNDIVLYRNLKYAGVAEYFFKPLVGDVVTRACNSILNGTTTPLATRTGKLVFILGVRGGVGATTIAVNIAWQLAETRQRWVMLLDLDLQGGDSALQLDAIPSHALREAVEHPERVDKLFLERAVIPVDHRIDLLASLEPLGESIVFNKAAVLTLLTNLLQRYRFIFVDLPASAAAQLLQVLHVPSMCVLVSDGTLASARDTARWVDWMGANTPERTMLYVLNQDGAPNALPQSEFLRAAGRAPDIIVPYDKEIASASILGVKGTHKCAALKRGLAPLLRQLSGEQVTIRSSLLKRIFG
jgi:pilus assembly protein CpaE